MIRLHKFPKCAFVLLAEEIAPTLLIVHEEAIISSLGGGKSQEVAFQTTKKKGADNHKFPKNLLKPPFIGLPAKRDRFYKHTYVCTDAKRVKSPWESLNTAQYSAIIYTETPELYYSALMELNEDEDRFIISFSPSLTIFRSMHFNHPADIGVIGRQ